MNGPHDMGGFTGFGPVDARSRRTRLAQRLGAPRLRAGARHGHDRQLEHRHGPPCARAAARRAYWPSSYYEMRHYALDAAAGRSWASSPPGGSSAGRMADAAEAGEARARRRTMIPAILASAARQTGPATGRRASGRATRSVHGTSTRLATPGCRAMRAAAGRDRRGPRTHVFPDSNAPWPGRGPAMALHRALHRARTVGQGHDGMPSASTCGNPIWRHSMNGAHDCGGMMGFGPVAREAERAGVPRAVGSADVRADVGRGRYRRLDARRGPQRLRSRCSPATIITSELLRALAARPADSCCRSTASPRRRRLAVGRRRDTCAKPVTPTPPRPSGRRHGARQLSRASRHGPRCSKPGDKVRTRHINPRGPHAPAALPAWPRGRDRGGAWRPCVSGFQCRRPGRGPAVALHRALHRGEVWGNASRDPDPCRSVGALS